MRIAACLFLFAFPVFPLVLANTANVDREIIARDVVEVREPAAMKVASWKRETEADSTLGRRGPDAEWKRSAQRGGGHGMPSWRREPEADSPGWKREPGLEAASPALKREPKADSPGWKREAEADEKTSEADADDHGRRRMQKKRGPYIETQQ